MTAVLVICGGTFAPSSTAASTTVATLQAEQMTLPSGASVVSSSTASGGRAVRVTNPDSSLTGSLALPSATTSIGIVAHGTRCQRGWPTMTASLDGTLVMNSTVVGSSAWQSYGAAISLGAGTHALSIVDTAAAACRTLYVDQIIFYGPAPAAPTVSLIAAPTSVVAGGSSTLTWSSTGATACLALGA